MAEPTSPLSVAIPSAGPADAVVRMLERLALVARADGLVPGAIVLVDDLPTRPTVRAACARLGIRRIVGEGRGPGPARNLGIAASSGTTLLFCDDDVFLDDGAIAAAVRVGADLVRSGVPLAQGLLRAPVHAPPWLVDLYARGIMTSVNDLRRPAHIAPAEVTSGLVVADRAALEAAGGFPEPAMGRWEDVLLGIALSAAGHDPVAVLAEDVTGVHDYVPTWEQWVDRMTAEGRRLGSLLDPTLSDRDAAARDAAALVANVVDGGGVGGVVRRILGHAPASLLSHARGRATRRLAGSSAFQRGLREGARR